MTRVVIGFLSVLVVFLILAGMVLFNMVNNNTNNINARHQFHQTQVCIQLANLTRAITVDPSLSSQVKTDANAYYITDCVVSG